MSDGDAAGQAPTQVQTEEFDALVVAVGCYTEPNLPAVPGMDTTPAFQMHCHNYRTPERFAGQAVLVVGASFSGIHHSLIGIHTSLTCAVSTSFVAARL